ncbi:MAG TPA: DUF4252 domain-containing protein [Cyclobacteriaceae bacterium]|nr:DUF4252 domain-containing protein [Cyclobacteriaceae bacterium]
MKKLNILILFTAASVAAFAQSKSYEALYSHFKGKEDVHAFSMGGMLCRLAVNVMANDNDVLKAMVKDIRHIRFIVIPKNEFAKQNLSINGFKGFLKKDLFEEMATIRDHGDIVSVFHRTDANAKDRYFVLVEDQGKVVAIEMKGTIDPALFKEGDNRITINK